MLDYWHLDRCSYYNRVCVWLVTIVQVCIRSDLLLVCIMYATHTNAAGFVLDDMKWQDECQLDSLGVLNESLHIHNTPPS